MHRNLVSIVEDFPYNRHPDSPNDSTLVTSPTPSPCDLLAGCALQTPLLFENHLQRQGRLLWKAAERQTQTLRASSCFFLGVTLKKETKAIWKIILEWRCFTGNRKPRNRKKKVNKIDFIEVKIYVWQSLQGQKVMVLWKVLPIHLISKSYPVV